MIEELERAVIVADKALGREISDVARMYHCPRSNAYRLALWTRQSLVAKGWDADTAEILKGAITAGRRQQSPQDWVALTRYTDRYRRLRLAKVDHADAIRRIASQTGDLSVPVKTEYTIRNSSEH